MKVCKFEKINGEDEIRQVIGCILREQPYAAAVPAITPLREWQRKLSATWFQEDDEASCAVIGMMNDFVSTLADRLIPDEELNCGMKVCLQTRVANIRRMTENKQDLLTDKMIKSEVYMLSSDLIAFSLRQRGVNAKTVAVSEFMQLNQDRVPDIPYIRESIRGYVNANRDADIFVVPLSLCKNVFGETDFMSDKRGDYYATALAAVLMADEVVLSTDMNNIYTDRSHARDSHSLTYTEAEQLVNSGVYLIYMDCITLAERYGVAVRLYDTNDLENERLYISSYDSGCCVKAVLTHDSVSFVRFTSLNVLPGYLFLGKLLEVVNKYKINVISMASSSVSVSMILTASRDTLRIVRRELHRYVDMVVDDSMSVVHIIGSLGWERSQIESGIMAAIKDVPVSFISYGGSDHCFTLAVHTADKLRLLGMLSLMVRQDAALVSDSVGSVSLGFRNVGCGV